MLLSTVDSDKYDYWKKLEVILIEKGEIVPFSVMLVARAMRNKLCSVNVDDVSLTPECIADDVSPIPGK